MPLQSGEEIVDSSLSLVELTARIGNVIHTSPAIQNVWVVAELSDASLHGGHFYADLIQKDDAGRTVARMRATIWRSYYNALSTRYFNERGEALRNGIKVKVKGSANHHNQYGLSFNITDLDPTYVDEGDILRRRMEILKALQTAGIADANKQVPVNPDMQRIAIISAEGAAGLGDFVNQLSFNPDGFRFTYHIFNSPMQGERAAAGVIDALGRIAAESDRWDCVVIIRGGGATADMNCFDDYELAKHVCLFELPVIVGIGHERDNCVLDYIANTRCKTPTAVAEFLVNHQREAWQKAVGIVTQITRETSLRLEGENRRLAQISTFVPSLSRNILEKETIRLKSVQATIPMLVAGATGREKARLEAMQGQLPAAAAAVVARGKEKLRSIFGIVDVLKPENTLKRGYSITRVDGKALRDASAAMPGAELKTELANGTITSTVS